MADATGETNKPLRVAFDRRSRRRLSSGRSRLKVVKRQMYGRAKLDLLAARLLATN
jgi:transposase